MIGGGPTGVEMAGAIAELARVALRHDFRNIDPREARIVLVEAGPRVLPAFPAVLSAAAHRSLEQAGRRGPARHAGHALRRRRRRRSATTGWQPRTIVWGAGVAASPAAHWLGAEKDRVGRVMVGAGPLAARPSRDLLHRRHRACALGADGKPLPGLAPVAKQQGAYVARVLRARLAGKPAPRPFRYRDFGTMATIGRRAAVADFGWLKLDGTLAWLLWGAVHVSFLIGFRNRLVVMLDWLWSYFTFQSGARLITGPGALVAFLPSGSWGGGASYGRRERVMSTRRVVRDHAARCAAASADRAAMGRQERSPRRCRSVAGIRVRLARILCCGSSLAASLGCSASIAWRELRLVPEPLLARRRRAGIGEGRRRFEVVGAQVVDRLLERLRRRQRRRRAPAVTSAPAAGMSRPETPTVVRPCAATARSCQVASRSISAASESICAGREVDRAGPAAEIGRLVDMLGIVGDQRTVGARQQIERGLHDAALERRIVGNAHRPAELERHPQRARRADGLGVLAHQADAGGGNALPLEEVAQRAHGARAGGSNRNEQGGVDLVGLQQAGEMLGMRLGRGGRKGAHEGVVHRGHRADARRRPPARAGGRSGRRR